MFDEELIENLSSILKVPDVKVFSNWSMSLYGLMLLSNEIQTMKRKKIIEFGSGVSSIVMARTISKYAIGGNIISIENDPYYYNMLNDFVHENQLQETIQLIYAPLCPCSYLTNYKWYDKKILREFIDRHEKFDMAIIDGPPAWNDKIKLSRYGAIPFIIDHLADHYSIFLDDSNRAGEKEIMEMWKERYKIDFTVVNDRIAISRNEQ